MIVTSRHRIVLACDNCHARFPVEVTVRYRPTDAEALLLSCTLTPDDQVMVALWADAHQGPFTKHR